MTAPAAGPVAVAVPVAVPVAAPVAVAASAPAPPRSPPELIAHGGGLVPSAGTVTNSLQALQHSAAGGFRLVEIDFCWTSDDQLVLIHDWDGAVENLLGLPQRAPTLAAFAAAVSPRGLTQLTLAGLAAWMEAHPGIDVVTDVKAANVRALTTIAREHPQLVGRFVPQIYRPSEYDLVRRLGYERIIYTLYRQELPDDEVLAFAAAHALFAVTMPTKRARTSLPGALGQLGVFVYAHTINDGLLRAGLLASGVDGVYTDALSPAQDATDRAPDGWPDWTLQPGDAQTLGSLIVPYLPPADPAFVAELTLRAPPGEDVTVRLNAHAADGSRLTGHVLDVPAAGECKLDVHELLTGTNNAWLALDADRPFTVTARWRMAGRPAIPWVATRRAEDSLRVQGPVDGLAGHLLVLVNPTADVVTLSVEREVGGELTSESVSLAPGEQIVRRYDLPPTGELSLLVQGGPFVAQTLRWNGVQSFLR